MEVLVTQPTADRFGDRIEAAAPGVRLLRMQPDGRLLGPDGPLDREAARPEVVWATADLFMPDAPVRPFFGLLLRAPSVRWLQSSGAGVDDPVFARLLHGGVRITTSHVTDIPIAEYVLRAVLDVLQRAGEWRTAQAEAAWRPHEFRELHATTWLVVGLGAIGQAVAVRARAFGARVIGVRRHPDGSEPADELITPDELSGRLAEADVVVLAAPATPSTAGLVDADFLAAMAPGSVLVNIARGALVDEDALLAALDRGKPGTAVLDVASTEPLPSTSPLWRHPQVVLTPHSSALGSGRFDRAAALFCDNLARFVAGGDLRHEISADDLGPASSPPSSPPQKA